MFKSVFKVSQMDCPSEENLIRMKLAHISEIVRLDFDLNQRKLTVYHSERTTDIETCILDLNLGGKLLMTEESDQYKFKEDSNQKRILWTVLGINFSFFLIEMSTGIISKSMGLIADSLDMLADSFVYGISLLAIGSSVPKKKRVAKIAGYFQLTLAMIGFAEVLRRFFGNEQLPEFRTMIVVSGLALIGNTICLFLLQNAKGKEEAHIKASMIFTSNDVIVNLGVIVAGILVHWLDSNKPDLIIGTVVFIIVIRGALRILGLAK